MQVVLHLYFFFTGAVVGSFLNVVIARVPRGESVVRPRSRCPRCKSSIAWFDNVPVVSWLVLRARCRACGLPISARYPIVEALTGVLALAIVRQYGINFVALGYFAMAAALVALAYIDLDTWLLPHEITWPLLALGLLSPLWNRPLGFVSSAAGAAIGFALFAAIALFGERILKRETMGWGDVWLLGGIGAWLGAPALLPVVMLSALQGAIVGSIMLAAARRKAGAVPADPAVAAAAPVVPPATDAAPGAPNPAADPAVSNPAADSAAPAQPASPADAPAHAAPAQDRDVPLAGAAPGAVAPEDDWTPPPGAVPYGPFLALAALQQLLLGDFLIGAYDDLLRRLWS